MARKKPELDGDAIAKAIAADLPGWKQVQRKPAAHDTSTAESGPSLADLRRKFLGADAAADGVADGTDDYGSTNQRRKTVTVQPEQGGPTKTADIVNGKVKIVQG